MQEKRVLLQIVTLSMLILIASNFLAAIPPARAADAADEIGVETYTITAAKGQELQTFEVAVAKSEIIRAGQMMLAGRKDAYASIMEIASQIQLTEEEKSTILDATSVRITAEDSSYIEITGWLTLWGLPYGASYHVHLRAMDAINLETALNTLPPIFAILTVLLFVTIIGGVLCAVIAFTLELIKLDYEPMYDNDHNADNSFDMWSEATFYQSNQLFSIIDTPRYTWLVMLGAYIIRDKTQPSSPLKVRGTGGSTHFAV